MSASSTVVSEEMIRYLAERTAGEDDFLRELKATAEAAGIPPIWISPEQASFMQVLLRAAGAREVIEVGTLAGYSAITMARALPPDGRVRTIELEPRHADFAEEWIARSDCAGKVVVERGDGREVLPRFESDSADAAFVDADKVGYGSYLDECARIVRRGGLVLVDNAFAFGQLLDEDCDDESVRAVRDFNERMAADDRFQGVITPIGDGCWVAVRR